jgi:glucose-1-phosphate thymidylyltransferase
MQGVVLAAGEGTRLRPLTADRPKGLVEVAGRPLLTHCFETLLDLGVDELVVVVGYRGDQVLDRYGDRFEGVPVSYTHQTERCGPAHALLQAAPHLAGDFLLLHGDNVCDANLRAVVECHRRTGADATLLVETVDRETATRTGVVEFDDDGRPAGLVEKPDDPPSTCALRGFTVGSPRLLDACRAIDPSATGEYELPAAVDLLLDSGGTVETVVLDGWCQNVNSPADVAAVERRLSGGE